MNNQAHSSRDRILGALRAKKAPFESASARPSAYMPVTAVEHTDTDALLIRFTAELERLTGKVHVASSASDALETVMTLIGDDRTVLAWDVLPLPGLRETMQAHGISTIDPHARGDARGEPLALMATARIGITGADAALAATGTLVIASNAAQSRTASLLPPVHITLLRRDRLYARLEDWIARDSREVMNNARSVAFITGPSRTSDIEMQPIIGVHGPKVLHVVVF